LLVNSLLCSTRQTNFREKKNAFSRNVVANHRHWRDARKHSIPTAFCHRESSDEQANVVSARFPAR
jgi:hypothetical protein